MILMTERAASDLLRDRAGQAFVLYDADKAFLCMLQYEPADSLSLTIS